LWARLRQALGSAKPIVLPWKGFRAALFSSFALLCSLAFAAIVAGQGTSLYPFPLDRFGINVALEYGEVTHYDVGRLRVGWYLDYRFRERAARPHGMQYAQVVRVRDIAIPLDQEGCEAFWEASGLGRAVEANPGVLWLIGNEPDTQEQDERFPADYAAIYHCLYYFIKGRDPTARLAAPNIVQPTPLRLQWLDMVLYEYQAAYGQRMPVDVWSIHNQILREDRHGWGCGIPPGISADQGMLYSVYDNANIGIFRQHVLHFRQWMRARGEREKPLIISEYGVLMPSEYLGGGDPQYGDEVVKAFMRDSFDYLLSAADELLGYSADGHRLVQQWAWYSLNDKIIDLETFVGYNGSLFDWRYPHYPGVITQFGLEFARYTSWLAAKDLQLPLLLRRQR